MTPADRRFRVMDAAGEEGLGHARRLFRAYADEFAASLAATLASQGFGSELAGLPGRYAPPSGCLLLAMCGGDPAGCVALRDVGGGTGEVKRLYVAPGHRGRGVGRLLVEGVVQRAERAGHERVVLDTLPEMGGAIRLYRQLGFTETTPYGDTPVVRTVYLEKRLAPVASTPSRTSRIGTPCSNGGLMSQTNPPQLLGPDPIAAAQRDDGSLSNDGLISAYDAGPQQLRDAVAGLTPEQLRARPVEGRWSTLEVVCHLADCEQFFADRLKRTIATDRPLLLGAQGGRYPEPLRYHDRDLDEELDLIALTRRQMARILRLQPEGAWGRTAVHSETGLVTLRQLVIHAVRHQEHHLWFVAEKRRALGE